jgi:GTP pyrophosphokinase
MGALKPERLLKVEWASTDQQGLNVVLAISAYDRRGLLHDLTEVLAVERLSIDAASTRTDHDTGIADFALTVAVRDLEQLARVLRRLGAVANVIETRRQR